MGYIVDLETNSIKQTDEKPIENNDTNMKPNTYDKIKSTVSEEIMSILI